MLLFAAYLSSRWFGVLCISLRSGDSAGGVPILSNSHRDALLHLCHVSGSRAVRTWALAAAGNSSLVEDTSHRKLMLMHCHGSKRHNQSYHGPQGCSETLTENHYLWAVSGIYPFFFFFQLFGSSWDVPYEGRQNGNSRTRNGSCWQNFLDVKSGYQPGESKGRTPNSLRVLGLLWRNIGGQYLQLQLSCWDCNPSGWHVRGDVSNPPLKGTWVVGELNPAVTGLHNYC